MKIKWQPTVIMLLVAIVAIWVARKLFDVLKLSYKSMDFQYINDSKKTQRWVDYMTPLAKEVGQKMGLPWQALVVQTAIETGWGASSLFLKYNNYAGIKAVGTQPFVSLPTKECNSSGCYSTTGKFRTWQSKYDGLIGYAEFFHKNGRYKKALQYPTDPKRFIEEIAKAGYATDPTYASKLKGMVDKYFG